MCLKINISKKLIFNTCREKIKKEAKSPTNITSQMNIDRKGKKGGEASDNNIKSQMNIDRKGKKRRRSL